jgi:hypothetical protein
MNIPQETIDRISAEAKKAAMVIEYGEYDPGPSNSARMQQTSRIDPIQKEFYIKGATKWAAMAQKLADFIQRSLDQHEVDKEALIKDWPQLKNKIDDSLLPWIIEAKTVLAKYKEVTDEGN